MSQKLIQLPKTKNSLKLANLNLKRINNSRQGIYSSRRQSLYPSESSHTQSQLIQTKTSKSRATSNDRPTSKQIKQIVIPFKMMQSIKMLNQKKLCPKSNLIKQASHKVLQQNSRQNRFALVDILQQYHQFFSKIHTNIAEAIILLSKPSLYYKEQLIFSSDVNQINPYKTLTTLSTIQSPAQKQNIHNPQSIGFIIYGKLQLSNDKYFYSNYLINTGTLFQGIFINKNDKIDYYANVLDNTLIFWLSKQSYYVIRRQSFLQLDLKYKFGEFQNMLKKQMVQKKLLKKEGK